jgi:hypothetical protein
MGVGHPWPTPKESPYEKFERKKSKEAQNRGSENVNMLYFKHLRFSQCPKTGAHGFRWLPGALGWLPNGFEWLPNAAKTGSNAFQIHAGAPIMGMFFTFV